MFGLFQEHHAVYLRLAFVSISTLLNPYPVLADVGHWSYDFLANRTEDGRKLKVLVVIDEFTRECLALEVGHTCNSTFRAVC